MWTVLIGAVLASIMGGEGEEEEKLEALGLGKQLVLTTWPFDFLVPVRAWPDGAKLFRIIGWPAYAAVEEFLHARNIRGQWSRIDEKVETDLDAGLDPSTVGTELSAYLYVEGPEQKPTALVLLSDGEAAKGLDDAGAGSIIGIKISNDRPKNSAVNERLWWFLAQEADDLTPGSDEETVTELWGGKGTVEDLAVDLLEAMKKKLEAGEDVDPLLDRARDPALKKWGELYRDLHWAMRGLEAEHGEIDFWAGADADDPEVREKMSEWMSEDEIEDILGDSSDKWGRRTEFEHYRRGQIEGLQDQVRELETDLLALADREVSAAEKYLWNIDVGGANEAKTGVDSSWSIMSPWRNSNMEDLDRLLLRSSNNGRPYFDLENGRITGNPVGLLDTLLSGGLAERESARENRRGEPSFVFPGELQGMWEMWALLGEYQPRADAPIALFLKIANDHGLLTEMARKRFEKLLREWEDPSPMMAEYDLTGN